MTQICFNIENLGIIKKFNDCLANINIFIGPNSSGKSILCKTISHYLSSNEYFSDLVNNLSPKVVIKPDTVHKTFSFYYLPDTRIVIKVIQLVTKYLNTFKNRLDELANIHNIGGDEIADIEGHIDMLKHLLMADIKEQYLNMKRNSEVDLMTNLYEAWRKVVDETYDEIKEYGYVQNKNILYPIIVDMSEEKLTIRDMIQEIEISTTNPEAISGGVAAYFIVNWLSITLSQLHENNVLVFIEEPENQAHPILQMMLADYIRRAVNILEERGKNIIFLITTHSELFAETMLRKITNQNKLNIFYPMFDTRQKKYVFIKHDKDKPLTGLFDAELLLSKIALD